MRSDQKLLYGTLTLTAGEAYTQPFFQQVSAAPLTYLVIHASTATEDVLVALPIPLDPAATWPPQVTPPAAPAQPAALPVQPPVYVGVMGPVEIVSVWDGTHTRRSVGIAGQFFNCTTRDLTLTGWTLTIASRSLFGRFRGNPIRDTSPPSFTPIDDILGTPVDLGSSRGLAAHSAVAFLVEHDVPWPGGGLLRIDATFDDSGTPVTVTYKAALAEAPRVQVRAPVEWTSPLAARWGFGNGVGAQGFHLHNIFPDRRYAYDIGFDDPSQPRPWRIDQSQPDENWNFLCWSRTVVAIADGVVVTADGSQPDHGPGITTGHRTSSCSATTCTGSRTPSTRCTCTCDSTA